MAKQGYHSPRTGPRKRKHKRTFIVPKPGQAKYVLLLEGSTYYNREISWGGCDRDKATHLTHKDANTLQGKFKRLGYKGASVEPLTPAE